MIPAQRIVAIARSWVGVPFVKYGRTRAGVDCCGLVIAVLRESGAVVPDFGTEFDDYELAPHRPLVKRSVQRYGTRVDARRPGVLLLLREHLYGWPTWFALDGGHSLIASAPGRGVIEVRAIGALINRLHSIWALPNVSYSYGRKGPT